MNNRFDYISKNELKEKYKQLYLHHQQFRLMLALALLKHPNFEVSITKEEYNKVAAQKKFDFSCDPGKTDNDVVKIKMTISTSDKVVVDEKSSNTNPVIPPK